MSKTDFTSFCALSCGTVYTWMLNRKPFAPREAGDGGVLRGLANGTTPHFVRSAAAAELWALPSFPTAGAYQLNVAERAFKVGWLFSAHAFRAQA